jgi:hypothetical protein
MLAKMPRLRCLCLTGRRQEPSRKGLSSRPKQSYSAPRALLKLPLLTRVPGDLTATNGPGRRLVTT